MVVDEVKDGFKEYIRIDSDREHIMRWEAEGVTAQVSPVSTHQSVDVGVQVRVDMSSPSCAILSNIH